MTTETSAESKNGRNAVESRQDNNSGSTANETMKRKRESGNGFIAWLFGILFLASACVNVVMVSGCCTVTAHKTLQRERDEAVAALGRVAKDLGTQPGLSPETTRTNIESKLKKLEEIELMSEDYLNNSAKSNLNKKNYAILKNYHEFISSLKGEDASSAGSEE